MGPRPPGRRAGRGSPPSAPVTIWFGMTWITRTLPSRPGIRRSMAPGSILMEGEGGGVGEAEVPGEGSTAPGRQHSAGIHLGNGQSVQILHDQKVGPCDPERWPPGRSAESVQPDSG